MSLVAGNTLFGESSLRPLSYLYTPSSSKYRALWFRLYFRRPDILLQKVQHMFCAWYIYKCPPAWRLTWRRHSGISKRTWVLRRGASLGLATKWMNRKHQLCDDRYTRHAGCETVASLDISMHRRAHSCSLLPDYSKRLSLSDKKAINFMHLVFRPQINGTSKTN